YSALILICLSFIYLFSKENKINNYIFSIFINRRNFFYFFLILFLFVSIIIGERSNFIKILFMSVFFLFLFENKNYSSQELNISKLNAGIYFMQINNSYTQKLIKK
ncbi:MAG: T9SS type A sorting domain-containing protein, partial [Lutibacter sp.]|nr:T9SS type A sorting domain-containing protein [Lutibacter sp.]